MTNKFKKRIRARMLRTSESYQTARRALEEGQATDDAKTEKKAKLAGGDDR